MKYFLILLLSAFAINIYSQTTLQWEDPYAKPNAPGYEELMKGADYQAVGDYPNTIIWFVKASDKGNLYATFTLALWSLNGENGVKPDTVRALTGIIHAAQKGYAPAQYATFFCYAEGIGVEKNPAWAFHFLEESAAQGYFQSKKALANCLFVGKGGATQNTEAGLKLTEECATAGDAQSQWVLGRYYCGAAYNEPDYSKAKKWFEIAANNGYWQALQDLAFLYAEEKGVEKDFRKAHGLIRDAKSKAEQSGQLTKEVEADLLASDGYIFLKEENNMNASLVWKQMKELFPEYVEKAKYDVDNYFVSTMYAKDQGGEKTSTPSESSSSLPLIISDIDDNIPENSVVSNPTFAVIISNENYNEVEGVPFAKHDGEMFKQYCEKTLGIPKCNIKHVVDATLNNIRREVNWLSQVMDVYQGEANIIFYYAGHGIPNESNGSAYLLPVDGVGNDVSTGYSLDKLYSDLNSKPAKSVLVLLDACFSGAKRDGGMLASARGVTIKAKQNAPKGNMVVLSAAQGDETAYPYKDKGHGLFTYYLLKKIQETKGDLSWGELADYVTTEVKKQSIVINGKMQTPLASPSANATDWRNWKLR